MWLRFTVAIRPRARGARRAGSDPVRRAVRPRSSAADRSRGRAAIEAAIAGGPEPWNAPLRSSPCSVDAYSVLGLIVEATLGGKPKLAGFLGRGTLELRAAEMKPGAPIEGAVSVAITQPAYWQDDLTAGAAPAKQ